MKFTLEKREFVTILVFMFLFLIARFMQVQYKEHIENEHQCLSSAIYWEAGNQGITGMKAVADVIKNRLESNQFKEDTYCDIIHAKGQFSFISYNKEVYNLENKLKGIELKHYLEAKSIASDVIKGEHTSIFPKNVLYYHADYVKPAWAKAKNKVKTIGNHIFYKGETK